MILSGYSLHNDLLLLVRTFPDLMQQLRGQTKNFLCLSDALSKPSRFKLPPLLSDQNRFSHIVFPGVFINIRLKVYVIVKSQISSIGSVHYYIKHKFLDGLPVKGTLQAVVKELLNLHLNKLTRKGTWDARPLSHTRKQCT